MSPHPRLRHALRLSLKCLAFFVLGLVAIVAIVLLAINVPPVNGWVAERVNAALEPSFKGRLVLHRLGHLDFGGLSDAEIAAALDVGIATVGWTRQRFVEANLAALEERPRPGGERKLTGKQEAHLVAVACTPAPAGQRRWTLRLLADKVVELGFADAIARETVRQVLKKMSSSRGSTSSGVCPP